MKVLINQLYFTFEVIELINYETKFLKYWFVILQAQQQSVPAKNALFSLPFYAFSGDVKNTSGCFWGHPVYVACIKFV